MECPKQYLFSVLFSEYIHEMAQKNSLNYQKIAQEVLTSSANKMKFDIGHSWRHLLVEFLQTKNVV